MTAQQREMRVLDAAHELVLQHGYDKTTMADVARAAGVSKGSIYLVFESKDELFDELLLRELGAFQARWAEASEAHLRFGTVGAMYETMLAALDDRPLMALILRRDPRLLGRYLHKPDNIFIRYASGQPTRHEALAMLQEAGAIRADVDAKVAAHVMNVFAYGLVTVGDHVAADQIPDFDPVIRLIGSMMDAALTPAGGPTEAGAQVVRRLLSGSRAGFSALQRERASAREARRRGRDA